jgi:hypothetical protein
MHLYLTSKSGTAGLRRSPKPGTLVRAGALVWIEWGDVIWAVSSSSRARLIACIVHVQHPCVRAGRVSFCREKRSETGKGNVVFT